MLVHFSRREYRCQPGLHTPGCGGSTPRLRPRHSRRDGNRCQYTGRTLRADEGSLDHIVPRSRGGKDTWENLVWSSKAVNARKANRLPHQAGLKLLNVPRAPKELPFSALIRNAHGVADWDLLSDDAGSGTANRHRPAPFQPWTLTMKAKWATRPCPRIVESSALGAWKCEV